MNGQSRVVLGVSLAVNVILFLAVVFLMMNRPPPNNEPIAQVEETATASATAVPDQPSATPVVITVVASPTAVAAAETTVPTQPAAPTAAPTNTPVPTTLPSPTPPPPTPTPAPTTAVYTGPGWLQYTNQFRAQAGLPFLVEDEALTNSSAAHSQYMVLNSQSTHTENPALPGYSEAGETAGLNGNIAISGRAGVVYTWPINYWMSAAFHALPLIDPELQRVGYGEFQDANSSFGMGATMDVRSGLNQGAGGIEYPVMFPGDGQQTWVRLYNLPEFPDTAASCPGYQRPTGAPIILQIGNGEKVPNVTSTLLMAGDTPLPHCVFDETNYTNPEPFWQDTGRIILNQRDAIVILPRSPLQVGETYTVTVVESGQEISWRFAVVAEPPPKE